MISAVKARALGLGRHQGKDPPAAVGAVAPIAVGDPAQLNAWGETSYGRHRICRSMNIDDYNCIDVLYIYTIHVSMYLFELCNYVCISIYVSMYVKVYMYVCMYKYICIYVSMYVRKIVDVHVAM